MTDGRWNEEKKESQLEIRKFLLCRERYVRVHAWAKYMGEEDTVHSQLRSRKRKV